MLESLLFRRVQGRIDYCVAFEEEVERRVTGEWEGTRVS